LPDGSIPSLGQRFTATTGIDPSAALFTRRPQCQREAAR
jgi:hypothetical protein